MTTNYKILLIKPCNVTKISMLPFNESFISCFSLHDVRMGTDNPQSLQFWHPFPKLKEPCMKNAKWPKSIKHATKDGLLIGVQDRSAQWLPWGRTVIIANYCIYTSILFRKHVLWYKSEVLLLKLSVYLRCLNCLPLMICPEHLCKTWPSFHENKQQT
jgi:hypothetical protein